jgi:hypothetical protein
VPAPVTTGPTPGGIPGPAGPAADLAATLAALDAKRSAAYTTGDAALLASLYTVGSPDRRPDLENLARLVAADERAVGFRTVAVSVTPGTVTADRAVLDVVDRVPPFVVTRPDGRKVRDEPGRGERRFTVALERVDGRWLYAEVRTGSE